jgi:protein phosphatase
MTRNDQVRDVTASTIDLSNPAQLVRPEVVVDVRALSHVGKTRENNEDQFLVARLSKALEILDSGLTRRSGLRISNEKAHLLLVADGMGGAAAGERASALVAEWIETNILEIVKLFFHFGELDERAQETRIRVGLKQLDDLLLSEAESDRALQGMGTTLTLGFSVGADLTLVHVGDSRAYLFHDGELEQLTHDHTLTQLMVDAGMLRPEDAKTHNRRHVVTNVLGGPGPGVTGEVHRLTLADGDRLLLCTDGLSDPVDDASIAAILHRSSNSAEACRGLVDAALQNGGPDNVTVIVATYAIKEPS